MASDHPKRRDFAIDNDRKILAQGCEQLQVAISPAQTDQLLAYHQLLIKWNKAYNLTAVRDPEQMIYRHLLDSLSIAGYLQGQRFIDVGTGAGLPGVVLAILFPDRQFDLLDSAGKKTRFLFQVKSELKLRNIAVYHERVERFQPPHRYDGVIARAFASLEAMVADCCHLLATGGRFYAMKGQYPDAEVAQLENLSVAGKGYKVEASHSLRVPGDPGQRHLLIVSREQVRA